MVGENVKNTTNIWGILLIISIIAFIVTIIIMNINPEQQQKVQANNKLTEDEMLTLIRYAQYHITESDSLESGSITDEAMIVFATDYMKAVGGYNITVSTDVTNAKIVDIESVVRYIFDRSINYSNVSFERNGEYMSVPMYPIGTDAQIYKFKSREYNETENIYTVSIDCLEVGTSKYSEIIEGSVTSYDERYVIETLVFKYKEIDGRKVLLAYNSVFNMNF